MLVKGKEVDLEELGGRADKAQIQKVIELFLQVGICMYLYLMVFLFSAL